MSAELRREPRYPHRTRVVASWPGQSAPMWTADISFRGLFLACDDPPRLQQLIHIDIPLPPHNEPLRLLGMAVHRVAPGGNRPPGIGVELYGNDPQTTTRWAEFVNYVRTELVDPATVEQPQAASGWRNDPQRAFAPELHVRTRSVKDLLTIAERDLRRRATLVRTELSIEPGVEVTVAFIHPETQRSFPIRGVVRRQIQKGAVRGLGVELQGIDEAAWQSFLSFVDETNPIVDVDADPDLDLELDFSIDIDPS